MEANSNTEHTDETARQAARSKLMQDLNAVIGDAEQWLKNSALQDNGKADGGESAAREQFLAALKTAKTDVLKMQSTALARGRLAARATDDYVNGHPWAAVAVGAAAGMLLGLLLSRTER
jgi:ElaB/YqjD/DUF883 family membrane-anchored ribosome-binding protein